MESTQNAKSNSAKVVIDSAKIYELIQKNMITKEAFDFLVFSNPKTSTNTDDNISMQSEEEIVDINATPEVERSASKSSKTGGKKCSKRKYCKYHPDKRYYAIGMCKQCYYKNLIKESKIINSKWGKRQCPKCRGRKYKYAKACQKCTKPKKIPQCHPDKPYKAKNMCKNCYNKYSRQNQRAKNKISK